MPTLNRQKQILMRQIHDHFNIVQQRRGTLVEHRRVMDVYHHPSKLGETWNYVTPRRGVAWVATSDLTDGLDRLATFDRTPRLTVIEGLFPPVFQKHLKSIGLEPLTRQRVMTYGAIPGCDQIIPETFPDPPSPRIATFETIDQNAVALWMRLENEELALSQDEISRSWEQVINGQAAYFLASDELVIAGGAGAIFTPTMAEIVGLPTLAPFRGRGIATTAIRAAVNAAQKRGATRIMMVVPDDVRSIRFAHRLGFVDLDRLVAYQRVPEEIAVHIA
jgi:GNAT superfamily N-acetyltransferase